LNSQSQIIYRTGPNKIRRKAKKSSGQQKGEISFKKIKNAVKATLELKYEYGANAIIIPLKY